MSRRHALLASLLTVLALALAACGGETTPEPGRTVTLDGQIEMTIYDPDWEILDDSSPGALILRPVDSPGTLDDTILSAQRIMISINTPSDDPFDEEDFSYVGISTYPADDPRMRKILDQNEPLPGTDWRFEERSSGKGHVGTAHLELGDRVIDVMAVQHGPPGESAIELVEEMVRGKKIQFEHTG